MQVIVEIKGLDGAIKRLEAIDKGLTDLSPFFKQAGAAVVESSQANFRAGGRPKWQPLSPATVLLRARGRKGYREHKSGPNKGRVTPKTFDTFIAGMNTLRDTGLLMASVGSTSKGGIYKLTRGSITVGTALKYAAAQQEGVDNTKGLIKGKRIPPRPFLLLQPEEKQRIYSMAVRFVDKAIKQ